MKHLFFIYALTFSACMFAQTEMADPVMGYDEQTTTVDGQTTTVDNQPAAELVLSKSGFSGIFETFLALVAFIPVIVQFFRKLLPSLSGLPVQIFSWAIGIVITIIGWLLHLGFLDGIPIWQALLYGAGASLAANGIFDTGIIQAIFGLFIKKPQAAT